MAEVGTLDIKINTSDVKRAQTDLAALEKSGAVAESAMSKLTNTARALVRALSVYKVLQAAKDAAMLAVRYETLGVVMGVVGKNAGYTAGQMEDMARGLQKTGISLNESRQSLTRMTQAQLDLTKSNELARVAQDAAVIGNVNSSEAFERLVVGIQSGQVEILRTIGLNVSFERSYQKLAQELRKPVAALTEVEKSQARMNAVLDSGKGISGAYAAALNTAGKQIGSLSRLHQDLGVEIGKTFGPAVTLAVEAYTAALKKANQELERHNREGRPIGTAEREWERVITNDPFATPGERTLQARAAADKAARASLEASDRGRAEMQAAKRQDQNAYDQNFEDRLMRGPKERQAMLGARVGAVGASSALDNLRAEMGGNELQIELTRLAGERAVKIAQYQSSMSDPNILPGVAGQLTKQRGLEEKAYGVRVDQAKLVLGLQRDITFSTLEQTRAENLGLDTFDQQVEAIHAKYELVRRTNGESIEGLMANRMEEAELVKLVDARLLSERQERATLAGLNHDSQANLQVQREMLQAELDKLPPLEKRLRLTKQIAEIEARQRGDRWYAAKDALASYADSAMDKFSNMQTMAGNFARNTEDALVNMATGGKNAFSDFANSVIKDLIRMQVRESITGPLFKGISGGGIASWFSGLFNANGNAFGPSGVMAFASGGVVSSPTAFRFGNGGANLGIMGEAGPEAIMPLKRGSDGKLGVAAQGGGGTQTVTVQIKDSKGKNAAPAQTFNSNGARDFILNVVLDGLANNTGGLRTAMGG